MARQSVRPQFPDPSPPLLMGLGSILGDFNPALNCLAPVVTRNAPPLCTFGAPNSNPSKWELSPVNNAAKRDGEDSSNQSEGATESSKAAAIASDQFFKTKTCIPFSRGRCRRGEKCCFAHGKDEMRGRVNLFHTKLCEKWLRDTCTSPDCVFAHGEQELRSTRDYFKTSFCKFWKRGAVCEAGNSCRHAHGESELRSRRYRKTQREKVGSSKNDGDESDSGSFTSGEVNANAPILQPEPTPIAPSKKTTNAENSGKKSTRKNKVSQALLSQQILEVPDWAPSEGDSRAPRADSNRAARNPTKSEQSKSKRQSGSDGVGDSKLQDLLATLKLDPLAARQFADFANLQQRALPSETDPTAVLGTPPGPVLHQGVGLQGRVQKHHLSKATPSPQRSGHLNVAGPLSPTSMITTPSSSSPIHRSASSRSFMHFERPEYDLFPDVRDFRGALPPPGLARVSADANRASADNSPSPTDSAKNVQTLLASIFGELHGQNGHSCSGDHASPHAFRHETLRMNNSSPSLLLTVKEAESHSHNVPHLISTAPTAFNSDHALTPDSISPEMFSPRDRRIPACGNNTNSQWRDSAEADLAPISQKKYSISSSGSALAGTSPVFRIVTELSPNFDPTSSNSKMASLPLSLEIDGLLVKGYFEGGRSVDNFDDRQVSSPHRKGLSMPTASSWPDLVAHQRLLVEREKQKQHHQILMQSSVSASDLRQAGELGDSFSHQNLYSSKKSALHTQRGSQFDDGTLTPLVPSPNHCYDLAFDATEFRESFSDLKLGPDHVGSSSPMHEYLNSAVPHVGRDGTALNLPPQNGGIGQQANSRHLVAPNAQAIDDVAPAPHAKRRFSHKATSQQGTDTPNLVQQLQFLLNTNESSRARHSTADC